jgi:putative phosphonate metabolism protein
MSPRYAVYFSPEHLSPWWSFGAHWLGRDEYNETSLPQPALTEVGPDELLAFTAEPRRYGLHATLMAPFYLRDGHTETDLRERMVRLATQLQPVALGQMTARSLGHFLALMPTQPCDAIVTFAARCVTELDDLRAPLSLADLTRRSGPALDARAQELLQRYGYPYVLERFQLHLTLSGSLNATDATRLLNEVAQPVAQLNASVPLALDRLCLFVEPARGQPFRRLADVVVAS